MKVGIMSMQRIINYGSFLQAFALSNIIKSLGYEVEFVDFKIEPCLPVPAPKMQAKDIEEKYRTHFFEIENFEKRFANEFLKDLGITERNERPEVDTLVIGSDEVFNCLQDNSDVGYSLELFGKDQKAKKLITYAASCGETTLKRIQAYNKHEEIANLLNQFHHNSVRDTNSKHFVESLSQIHPESHLDPVLVYDFSNDVKDTVNIEDYIIVYAYPFNLTDEECDYIKKFAQEHGKKIVSVGSYQKCTDIFVPAHPLEVLPYFKKADFVITNTFHGSIFSTKAHTPFISFTRNYNGNKLTDLLDRLQLKNRLVTSLDYIEEKWEEPIDFSRTDAIICEEKEKSIDYLRSHI